MSADLSHRGRARNLGRMRDELFDVCVVGGGIVGAAIARDSAMRGFRTALLEKGDFASGTSGKTSRLVHGGLRYLANGRVRLVRQAVRERDLLLRNAPALVHPLPFTIPAYRGRGTMPIVLRVGLWLYDALSRDKILPRHRWLSPEAAREREPGLSTEGLLGGALYYDAVTEDTRLVLDVLRSAVENEAVVANYCEVRQFLRPEGAVRGVRARDRSGGGDFDVRSRAVVNATGVWLERLRSGDGVPIRPTKGVHILLPRERVGNREAVTLTSPRDGRVLFVLPWGDLSLVGTTDTDYDGKPENVVPDGLDVSYLLETVNTFFPDAHVASRDVVSLYAGLRPLLRSPREGRESDVSREHRVFVDRDELISVGGGKLTTHRAMAEEVVDLVGRRLGRREPCTTALAQVGPPAGTESAFLAMGLPPDTARHLASRYDPDEFGPFLGDAGARERILTNRPCVIAEVDAAVEGEMALTLEDVLVRRLGMFYETNDLGTTAAPKVAERMGRHLEWSDERIRAEVDAYSDLVRAHLAFRGP